MNIKNIKSKPSALLSATREWMPISKIENICMSSANCILRAQLHVGHGTGPLQAVTYEIHRSGMWETRCQSNPFPLSQDLARSEQPRMHSCFRAVRPFMPFGKDLIPGQSQISSVCRLVRPSMPSGKDLIPEQPRTANPFRAVRPNMP